MPKYIIEKPQLYTASIYNPIHRFNFWVAWCDCRVRLEEYVIAMDESGCDIERIRSNYLGLMYPLEVEGQRIPLICLPFKWDRSVKQIAIIAHEVVHAVIFFFRCKKIILPKDISPKEYDEENLCYFIEWMMEQILDRLDDQDNNKQEIKGEKEYVKPDTKGTQKVRRNK